MKQFVFIVCLFFCNTQSIFSQINTESRLIASSKSKFDGSGMVPVDSTKLSYAGNNGWDKILERWKYSTVDVYEYNISSYKHYYRITRSFNVDGQTVSAIGEVWDNITGNWIVEAKDNFSYTPTGQIAISVTAHYTGTAWDSNKVINTYSAGILTETLTQQWNYATSTWDDMTHTANTYTSDNLTIILSKQFIGGSWVNLSKTTNLYNANNDITVSETQRWNGTAWENRFRLSHTYNSNNEQTATLRELYTGGMYINQYEIKRTFNDMHQVTTETRKTWNAVSSHFEYAVDDYLEYFYYEGYVSSVKNESVAAGVNIFPQPATMTVNVICNDANNQGMQVAMYNITGATVTPAISGVKTCSIDVSALATGNYFLHITINGYCIKRLISVLR